jgi:hypothetical protein
MAEVTRREHVFRDVLGALVAAAILGGLGSLAWALDWFGKAWEWFGEAVQLPRWWYGFLLLFLVAHLVLWAAILLHAMRKRPEYVAYREDHFFGMRWRWDWDWAGRIIHLTMWCPRCDRQAVYDVAKDVEFRPLAILFCQECQAPHEMSGTLDQVRGRVEREIDLKVRKGTWKSMVRTPGK